MVAPYKPLYTISETAEVLELGINAVYDLINSGALPHIKLGAKKVKGIDLEKFIEEYPVENCST